MALSPDELAAVLPDHLERRCDVSGLDIVELRAVYAAARTIEWSEDQTTQRAWQSRARERLIALVDKERRGTLLPHETRRPEYDLS